MEKNSRIQPGPATARAVGLQYVNEGDPGIRRRRAGKGFAYIATSGRPVKDRDTLHRIRALAIPPAWTDVWICPGPGGHIQATGRDAKGRKQYRYHHQWREVRDQTKFSRMIAFGTALPAIRRRIDRDKELPGVPREKVLGAVVDLLDRTLMRVGNPEYAKKNGSYGITTLRDHHADIDGDRLQLSFRGKTGKQYRVGLKAPRLAAIVKRCQDLPGHHLFQYEDPRGVTRPIDSEDVNGYIREIAGQDFTAKDFRTWAGTVLAALALGEQPLPTSKRNARRHILRAIEAVSGRLGNTPSICRKCYIHPAILDAYAEGLLHGRRRSPGGSEFLYRSLRELRSDELLVISLLRRAARKEREEKAGAGGPILLAGARDGRTG